MVASSQQEHGYWCDAIYGLPSLLRIGPWSSLTGSPSCDVDTAFSSTELEADVTTAINATLRPLVAAAIRDVQNALLREHSPFPGERLSSGAPAVCTSP